MKVSVKLFAAARDIAGLAEADLAISPGATVANVKAQLSSRFPQLQPLLERSLVAVNSEYAADASPVSDGDEVALIPPVSGG
jgi:molybdopterin converting factor subunit 1